MMITAMEAPIRCEADAIRDEKVKVLRGVRPLTGKQVHHDTVRGQYAGYSTHDGVAPGSQLLGVWPALVARELIESRVEVSLLEAA